MKKLMSKPETNRPKRPTSCKCGLDFGHSSTCKPTPSEAGAALSALGASRGGKASAAKMTPRQRIERARKASLARWSRKREDV
jgi:hypothetical protein